MYGRGHSAPGQTLGVFPFHFSAQIFNNKRLLRMDQTKQKQNARQHKEIEVEEDSLRWQKHTQSEAEGKKKERETDLKRGGEKLDTVREYQEDKTLEQKDNQNLHDCKLTNQPQNTTETIFSWTGSHFT